MAAQDDGTVLPSFLGTSSGPGPSATQMVLNDVRLHSGRIVAVHPPDVASNANKQFYEYDVEVDVGAGLTKVYPRAVMMDPLGGVADHYRWTPRISQGGSGQTDLGTRVLLLCLDGQAGRSLILGGAKHHGSKVKDNRKNGHCLEWEFNGIHFGINDAGEMTLVFRGATNADGTLRDDVDAEAANATVHIDKDGSLHIYTIDADSGDDEHRVVLNHKSGDFEITSKGNHTEKLDKELSVEANKGFHMNSNEGGFNVGVKKKMIVESAGVELGDATDKMLLGSKHIQDLGECLQSLMQMTTMLGTQLSTAGGSMSVPITGAVAAGPQIAACSTICTQMMQAMMQLKGKLETHLSEINKLD